MSFLESPSFRYSFPVVLLVAGFIAVVSRIVYIQLNLLEKNPTTPNRTMFYETKGLRGGIYSADKNAAPFAKSIPLRFYYLDSRAEIVDVYKKKGKLEKAIDTIANALELPREKVVAAYNSKSRNYFLKKTSDNTPYNLLSGPQRQPGLKIEEIDVRQYPFGQTAVHVVGCLNKDSSNRVGVCGIELSHHKHLLPIAGQVRGFKTAKRREVRALRTLDIEPKDGHDIHLTIIPEIQCHMEEALYDGLTNSQAEAGWAIAMDVKTGAVLAMASLPTFEPETFNKFPKENYRNRAISFNYEPGSVMKTITAAAALNEGTSSPDKTYYTEKSAWYYCGKVLHESHKMDDYLSLRDALVHSSNITYAKVGLEIGYKRLREYMLDFGFGAKTGIDLPSEEGGLIGNLKNWERDKLKWSRAPIGQGVAVTAIQLCSAYAAIGNDGVLMRPYVISKIVSRDGEEIYKHSPVEVNRVIRPEVARELRKMMLGVAKRGGTARRAAIPGYTIAGKTGTAQMPGPNKRGYSSTDFWGTFVGIIPATTPRLAILVTYQKGNRKIRMNQGGQNAAPVFKRIAEMAMRYLEVAPDFPDEIPEYQED
jgi:cell division protein FtsI (penicillin-binding protein 3)